MAGPSLLLTEFTNIARNEILHVQCTTHTIAIPIHKLSKSTNCPCTPTNYTLCHGDGWEVDVEIHVPLTSTIAGGEWSASHPGRFTPGEKRSRYPLKRRLDGPPNRSGRRGEEKIIDTTWDSNSDPSVVQPVAIPTALSRLLQI
jgi:hypothetical protein